MIKIEEFKPENVPQMNPKDFTVEGINAIFDNFYKATDELVAAMKFLGKLKIANPETWVTTGQASKRSGTSIRTIQNWANAGKVRSHKIGHRNIEVVLEDVYMLTNLRSKAV